jgi:hypothetical protein
LTFYDAFGAQIRAAEIDDCGIPKLPTTGSYKSDSGNVNPAIEWSIQEQIQIRNP